MPSVRLDGDVQARAWALNEVSLERTNRERMLEIAVAVDDRPLLRFGCDGILCATPTGSTAYAFSAGGPIVWPNVDALCWSSRTPRTRCSPGRSSWRPTSVVDIDLVSAGPRGGAQLRRPPVAGRAAPARGCGCAAGRCRSGSPGSADWSFADRLVGEVPAAGAQPARGRRLERRHVDRSSAPVR